MTPLVTVIMPVFNAERFLSEAIQSILDQHYRNFELLIYNDGSTDKSRQIIDGFSDNRIVSFHSEENKGYIHHLNHGLAVAKGKYIARMDADDISVASRLDKQVKFMETSPDTGICGSFVALIDDQGRFMEHGSHYVDDASLRIRLLADSCFAHPAVMIRKRILDASGSHYNPEFFPAEDYKLWFDLSTKTKFANLPEVLLKYRVHQTQITQKKKDVQKKASDVIRKKAIEAFLGYPIAEKDFDRHRSLVTGNFDGSKNYINEALEWLSFLINHNRTTKKFAEGPFENYVAEIWFSLCTHSPQFGWWIIVTYYRSPIRLNSISKTRQLKFLIKSIIGFSPRSLK